MFMGPPFDRRAHAMLALRLLADRAADPSVSLQSLGEVAREIASCLLDDDTADAATAPTHRFRVIEGGRR